MKVKIQLLILLFAKIGFSQYQENRTIPDFDTCYSYYNKTIFHSSNSQYYSFEIHQLPYNEWDSFQIFESKPSLFSIGVFKEENRGKPYVIIMKFDTINIDTVSSFFPSPLFLNNKRKTSLNIKKELIYTYFFKSVGISNLLSRHDTNIIRIVYPTHFDRKNFDIIEFKVIGSDSIKVNFKSIYCKNLKEYEILKKDSCWLNKRSCKYFYKLTDRINFRDDSSCYECTEKFLESDEFFIEQNIYGYSYNYVCPYSELDTKRKRKKRKYYRNFLGFAKYTREIYFQEIPSKSIYNSQYNPK